MDWGREPEVSHPMPGEEPKTPRDRGLEQLASEYKSEVERLNGVNAECNVNAVVSHSQDLQRTVPISRLVLNEFSPRGGPDENLYPELPAFPPVRDAPLRHDLA